VIREKGFINYFGMQRFGHGKIRTHTIGMEVLRKNWRGVVETLLLEDTFDEGVNRQKKELYEQGEYRKAERLLGNKYMIQKNLFAGLARLGANYCSVFESLPRNSRMIYGHALQSYIWNRVVSRRIKDHGPGLMIGDLVAVRPVKPEKLPEEAEVPQEEEAAVPE
jgi:tRNA pseudouridine13 synthase